MNNMQACNIQDILALIENPSRYLGTEINTVRKDFQSVRCRIALVFPDLYEIGTSHFGLQILYHLLNRHPDILAERVFAPAIDFAEQLRGSDTPLPSLESRMPLRAFDIIGFSLLYELNYTNILSILELSNIPFRAAQRQEDMPVIIAGGPCTCNPEPVAEFFDAMVIGDGESVTLQMAETWMQWKSQKARLKQDLLKAWAGIEGVYVPVFFRPRYDGHQQILEPLHDQHTEIKRAIVDELDSIPFPEDPVVPFGRPVHDRLRLEIARGCTRGCRFCQAGMIYRPVRERHMHNVLQTARRSLDSTGYEDVSLLSLSTGDYACIVQLIQQLMQQCRSEHVAVSLPSLRAGTLTPEMMQLIKKVRKTGFTIAPEAGSQRLRDVINKNISDEEILQTVKDAFQCGWSLIKCYFMIGLPGETDRDVEAIVELAHRLKSIRASGRRKGQINVSAATFIPKPHTPFQWSRQLDLDEARSKIRYLQDRLRTVKGIHYKWQKPETSVIEGIFARGDRRLSHLIEAAYANGCRFDGWSDHFRYDLWESAWQSIDMDVEPFYLRERGVDEVLPWDHIDTRVNKQFLVDEWNNARSGRLTADCRFGDCNLCGVCDFENVRPIVNAKQPLPSVSTQTSAAVEDWQTVAVRYAKRGQARFFGHLEFTRLVMRAIKRAGLSIRHSQGFHPKPKIRFDDPLPVGVESLAEVFMMTLPAGSDPGSIPAAVNPYLPDGISILECRIQPTGKTVLTDRVEKYRVAHHQGAVDMETVDTFMAAESFTVTRTRGKGRVRQIDLRKAVQKMFTSDPVTMEMDIVRTATLTVRPADILQHVFGFTDEQIRQSRIIKTEVISAGAID